MIEEKYSDDLYNQEEENKEEETSKDISDEIIPDDEIVGDIVLEIEDDDLDFDITEEEDKIDEKTEGDEEIILSKHTIQGKHSLKYDSIFKGKKEEPLNEEEPEVVSISESFEVDKSSNYWFESIDNENYVKEKRVKEKVYEVLVNHTDISFLNNRRKPSRSDFNNYYYLLKLHLKDENFTNVELFNELAVYFSDNLFNMFKLLDNKWKTIIIKELQEHIGSRPNNMSEITNRHIYINTEVEFSQIDNGEEKLITGVVIETDYQNSMFTVNSYENIFVIPISDITKILKNNNFKYNLNKLNNIYFL